MSMTAMYDVVTVSTVTTFAICAGTLALAAALTACGLTRLRNTAIPQYRNTAIPQYRNI